MGGRDGGRHEAEECNKSLRYDLSKERIVVRSASSWRWCNERISRAATTSDPPPPPLVRRRRREVDVRGCVPLGSCLPHCHTHAADRHASCLKL